MGLFAYEFKYYHIIVIVYIILLLALFIYYFSINSNILIEDNKLYFPRQMKFTILQFLFAWETFKALFKEKPCINISDIKSIDYSPFSMGSDFSKSITSISDFANMQKTMMTRRKITQKGFMPQPIKITLKNGNKLTFSMAAFSKRTMIKLFRTLKEINPKINFSKFCKELIELKSGYSLTDTEKKDIRKSAPLLILLVSLLILVIGFVVYLQLSGEIKSEYFDIDSVGIGTRDGKDSIKISTKQGTKFSVTLAYKYEEQGKLFLSTINADKSLYNNILISYKSRLGGSLRNVVSITLSDGQVFKLGSGEGS